MQSTSITERSRKVIGMGGRGAQASRLSSACRVPARTHLLAPAGGTTSAPSGASCSTPTTIWSCGSMLRFTQDLMFMNAQNHTPQYRVLPCYTPFHKVTTMIRDSNTHTGGSRARSSCSVISIERGDSTSPPPTHSRLSWLSHKRNYVLSLKKNKRISIHTHAVMAEAEPHKTSRAKRLSTQGVCGGMDTNLQSEALPTPTWR